MREKINPAMWYCFWPEGIRTPSMWRSATILTDYMLPAFLVQIVVMFLTVHALDFVLRPLRQPRVVAEILSGILLGPSFLGTQFPSTSSMLPSQNFAIIGTVATFALIYYVFLVGVELDVNAIRRLGVKVVGLAVAGMALPFAISSAAISWLNLQSSLSTTEVKPLVFHLYVGTIVSITGFPVLARMITELKLVNSGVGPVAMASAIISSILSFIMLIVCLAIGVNQADKASIATPLWVTLTGAAFVAVCFWVIRPAIKWMLRRMREGEQVSDVDIGLVLAGAAAAGFISDAIGMHSIFGAFVYGLAIPNGPLTTFLIQRMELFIVNTMLPLFFLYSGMLADLQNLVEPSGSKKLAGVLVLTVAAKVAGTLLAGLHYSIPFHESVSLGFLATAKGPLVMILLKIGMDDGVVTRDFYSVMTAASVLTTLLVAPVVTWTRKPARVLCGGNRRRQLERSRPDAELRMLACVHNTRQVHSITRLLDLSNPTKRSPVFVCAVHLVELTGRASAMVIMHNTSADSNNDRHRSSRDLPYGQAQSESIISAFDSYEQHAAGVSIQPLTAFSSPSAMHEDVWSLAEERHSSLIVLPFHKHQTVDGKLTEGNPHVRTVNQNVLAGPPCSVAIFVDRTPVAGGARFQKHHSVAVLFFGGPDDREALAYASRMAEHQAINLTVVRFVEGLSSVPDTPLPCSPNAKEGAETDLQKMRDEEVVDDFRLRFVSDETVLYTEKVVSNSEETVAAVRSMESIYDLYVVGRGSQAASPLTKGLAEWSECPELGVIGDLLVSADFGARASVLVMQQYVGKGTAGDGAGMPMPLQQSP